MARQPTFTVHISLTVSLKNVYSDLAERLLMLLSLRTAMDECHRGRSRPYTAAASPVPLSLRVCLTPSRIASRDFQRITAGQTPCHGLAQNLFVNLQHATPDTPGLAGGEALQGLERRVEVLRSLPGNIGE